MNKTHVQGWGQQSSVAECVLRMYKTLGLVVSATVGKKTPMEIKNNKKICLQQQVSDKAHETISFKGLTRFTINQLNIND